VRDLLAVACGMVGVILIERPRLGQDQTAALVALLSGFFAAVALLGLHRLKDLDPRAVVAHFAGVASAVAAFVLAGRTTEVSTLATTLTSPRQPLSTFLLLGGVGLTGTVGQVFLTKAYTAGIPSEMAVISLTQVIFGLLFDFTFWGHSMSPLALLGMALILVPTAWISVGARLVGSP
jgi:drug/metabolite transporter (DMT)-like permease